MEAICSYETSVDFQRATWRYIPEDGTLLNQCCENLKSKLKQIAWYIKIKDSNIQQFTELTSYEI
jgi:hypothetical protein